MNSKFLFHKLSALTSIISILLISVSCSKKVKTETLADLPSDSKKEEEITLEKNGYEVLQLKENADTSRKENSETTTPTTSWEFDWLKKDLDEVSKLVVNLKDAQVEISQETNYKKGTVRVSLLKGDKAVCIPQLIKEKAEIILKENAKGGQNVAEKKMSDKVSGIFKSKTPKLEKSLCSYKVQGVFPKALEISAELKRGSFFISSWNKPISLKVEFGDIDLEKVSKTNIECVECNLSGEEVDGELSYKIDSGNVGFEGLTDSVVGETLGDSVLHWKKFPTKGSVTVLSKMGNIHLKVPRGLSLNADLKAPRGDIYVDEGLNTSSGIAFAATAEGGSVRVLMNR